MVVYFLVMNSERCNKVPALLARNVSTRLPERFHEDQAIRTEVFGQQKKI